MPSQADQDEDPFLVTSDLEIRSVLRSVQRHGVLVRMYMQGHPDHSIMTAVLDFDEDRKRVIVDCAPDPELNERLLKAAAVEFDTQLDQISIHFKADQLEACMHDGLPALCFPFPESLRRIQRREFYRVEIPVGEPISCMIPLVEPGQPPRRVTAKLKDLSAGGLGLLDTDNQLPHEAGTTLKDARLTLPEVGVAVVDLYILRVHTVQLPTRKEIVELGCKFVNIPNSTTLQIQSYIGRLERRLNAKRRGF